MNARRWPLGTTSYSADARRIVAAVNAVAGIPTGLLEGGVVQKLLNKHIDVMLKENRGLREIVEEEVRPRGHAQRRRPAS